MRQWAAAILSLLASVLLAGCRPASPAKGITAEVPLPSVARGTGALLAQPSPSAPAPTPAPTSPPPVGATLHLGINEVQDLAFAPDGSLWAATDGGVARWDLGTGTYVQYTAADGLASNYVTGVAVAPDGSLWFSTESGVSHFVTSPPLSAGGSSWTTHTTADGLAAGAPMSVAVTPGGEVWVGTTDGVSHFDGETWTSYLPGRRAYQVAIAPDGAVWFANHGAGVNRYSPADDTWTAYTEADGLPLRGVTALTVGLDGDAWIYENWEGVYRLDGGRWQEVQEHVALVCALAVSPRGVPWIGTCGSTHSRFGNLIHGEGDGWIEVGGWHELGQPAIQAFAFGPGDTLAVGTEKGLAVYQDGTWRTLRGGPTRNRVTAVAVMPDRAAWFGFGNDQFSAAGGGVSRFDASASPSTGGGEWRYFLGDANVRVLAVAPDGALWAGVDCGVQRFDGQIWQVMAECGDLGVGNVLDLAFGPDGEVRVATGMSLARYDGQAWAVFDRLVHSIAVTPDGALWASGWEGALDSYYVSRFDGVEWEKILDDSLGSLAVTPDGAVWGVEGERGLVRFDGQAWEQVLGASGQPIHGSLTIAPDGALWVNGQEGLARLDGQGWAVYPGGKGSRAMAVAPDGDLWLGTSNGAMRFQPKD